MSDFPVSVRTNVFESKIREGDLFATEAEFNLLDLRELLAYAEKNQYVGYKDKPHAKLQVYLDEKVSAKGTTYFTLTLREPRAKTTGNVDIDV
jgi:hypothetical protein